MSGCKQKGMDKILQRWREGAPESICQASAKADLSAWSDELDLEEPTPPRPALKKAEKSDHVIVRLFKIKTAAFVQA